MKTIPVIDYYSHALDIIRGSHSITRNLLASTMGISLSMANRVVNELLEEGLIFEKGQLESSGGRPASLLALHPQAAYAIGIDYGEKYQQAVVTDLTGKEICHLIEKVVPTENQEVVIASLLDLIQRITLMAGVPRERILGLGIGIRDIVDASTGTVYGINGQPNWGAVWVDFPLLHVLKEKTSFPHLVVDDIARAMGTAEALYTAGLRGKDFLFVLADEGIGMAIMIDGKPFTGFSHIAGEIGHVPVADGPMCVCGNQGCLCLHAATAPIEKKVRDRIDGKPQQSVLRKLEVVEIDHIIEAARRGDKLAYQSLVEAGEYLGKGLAIAVNLLGPQHIVVGGKLAESEEYLQSAHHMIKLLALDKASRFVQLERTALKESAGRLGAATLALNALFEPGERNLLGLIRDLKAV